ncbi:hypothetical protein C7445_12810 [Alicyclobacillus sacchari]|uniref:Uncharacterized protein n=1 Tax=Alicyclobacillus sacchari TaxID=392010 RepID=A0A4R8L9C1_9BACL|nr:hypothetical protein [Alicyclobacillus sacchari]TDY38985.1 hypothetical protein C7445_12810 [Alicyclobacillus sacchari]
MKQKKPLLLDKVLFPETKINYMNGPTMRTIKKLQDQLQTLKNPYRQVCERGENR